MSSNESAAVNNETDIEARVITVLNDVTADWDLDSPDGIGPQTRLMEDLGFESIDVVQFVVSLEQEFDKKGLPFEQLFMKDGDYVDELRVQDVVNFLSQHV